MKYWSFRLPSRFNVSTSGPSSGLPVGNEMPRAAKEVSDTCLPGPAVNVLPVVDNRIERDEGGSLGTGATLQVIIEEPLPGSGMDAGRTGDHAVQGRRGKPQARGG